LFLRIGGRSVPFGRSAESGFAVDNRPFILNLKAEVLRPSLASVLGNPWAAVATRVASSHPKA
jgi:hypothetical protein